MKLEIGADKKRDGWKTLDLNTDLKPDIIDDCQTLEKIEDESISELFASHVIEHILDKELLNMLILWRKKMKKNALLTIYVPDIMKAYDLYKDSLISEDTFLVILTGSKPDNILLLHKTFFWPARLEKKLYQAGFRNMVKLPARGSRCEFGMQCRKINDEKYFQEMSSK